MKKKNDDPPLWLTVLKLLVGLIVIIAGVGGALYLASKAEQRNVPATGGVKDWGIVNDSPLRNRR